MVVMRVRESLWVMPAWQRLRFVAFADAAALVRMRAARSEMDLELIWAEPSIAILIDNAAHIDIPRANYFYEQHTLVKCSDLDNGRPQCGCDVHPGESMCAHVLALLAKGRPNRYPWLRQPLPLGTGGRAGTARTGRGRGGAFDTQEGANARMDDEAAIPRPTRKRLRIEDEAVAMGLESAGTEGEPQQPTGDGASVLIVPSSFQADLNSLFGPSDMVRVEGMC